MRVLGLESSCDETAAAVYDSRRGLLAEALYSQAELHADYGGVVPELAARDHIRHLLPLIRQALAQASPGTAPDRGRRPPVEGIAYTAGPGLIGCLVTAAAVGRALACAWQLPCLGVHHLEGHLLAPMLESPSPAFPFLGPLVSGAHTQLVEVRGLGDYRLLGESLDDAAGEAFDKTAKLLGLDYPGGAALARLAAAGDPARFAFPRPLLRRGLDFSFSGLKTAVRRTVESHSAELARTPRLRADLAASFQEAMVEVLVHKSALALKTCRHQRLVVAGGVGANLRLRTALGQTLKPLGTEVFFPAPRLCTDNAAMIAYAGCQRLLAGEREQPAISARARWPLEELQPPPAQDGT